LIETIKQSPLSKEDERIWHPICFPSFPMENVRVGRGGGHAHDGGVSDDDACHADRLGKSNQFNLYIIIPTPANVPRDSVAMRVHVPSFTTSPPASDAFLCGGHELCRDCPLAYYDDMYAATVVCQATHCVYRLGQSYHHSRRSKSPLSLESHPLRRVVCCPID
jgi:hypothetical protein